MRYRGSLELTTDNTADNIASSVIELCYGDITEVWVFFPHGHVGLTHLQIFHQERQIFPLTPGESFRGDGFAILITTRWPIHEVPHSVELRGWTEDDTYTHTIYVEISVSTVVLQPVVAWVPAPLPEGV